MTIPSINKKILIIGICLISCIVIASGGFFLWKYRQAQDLIQILQNKDQTGEKETAELVEKVAQLAILPTETPTVATVTDEQKLIDQPFFANAKKGDKVLIYAGSKKAYLYRPESHQIVDIGALNLDNPAQNSTSEPKGPQLTVALYNGTSTIGLTNTFQTKFTKLFPDSTVELKENATKSDYTESFIVDLAGNQKELATQVATQLKLPLKPLPEGEKAPATQFLIILGNDVVSQ